MKKIFFCVLLLPFSICFSQPLSRPKLVIGMVVDQMRWDYLYRFYDRYGNDGLKRLLKEGFSCEQTYVPYTPTTTAAGHSCIYTGSVPALHGIIGNSWFDRVQKKIVYCVDDTAVRSVGSKSSAGKMSPRNLWAGTVTDELRLATNFKSKTISIAIKDRASILPGGHASNGSFWFDNATGAWITSTFYMNELPDWMRKFNDRKLPDAYLKENWNTLYPIKTYLQSTADSNSYEGKMPGEDFTFPHNTSTIGSQKYEAFRHTPHGITYTLETAKAAIEGEQLGLRGVTDFLALSFSSTDLVGHVFGPNSVETEDTYLRLDRDIATFLKYLDTRIGKGQYLLFLTADHAVAQNVRFLRDRNFPVGSFDLVNFRRQLNDSLVKKFNTRSIISNIINYQVYLDDSVLQRNNIDKKTVSQYLVRLINANPAVTQTVILEDLANTTLPEKPRMMLTNGYNVKGSGDLQILLRPQWSENWQTGSAHAQWNAYDSHIPLVWYGWKIKPGQLVREVYMTDIAPTLAALLHIQVPNACVGKVIGEVIE